MNKTWAPPKSAVRPCVVKTKFKKQVAAPATRVSNKRHHHLFGEGLLPHDVPAAGQASHKAKSDEVEVYTASELSRSFAGWGGGQKPQTS